MFFGFLFFEIGPFLDFQLGFSGPFLRDVFTTEGFSDGGIVGFSDADLVSDAILSSLSANRCQFRALMQLFTI